jgi:hypothetical protein
MANFGRKGTKINEERKVKNEKYQGKNNFKAKPIGFINSFLYRCSGSFYQAEEKQAVYFECFSSYIKEFMFQK